jgi:streptogramin lyase
MAIQTERIFGSPLLISITALAASLGSCSNGAASGPHTVGGTITGTSAAGLVLNDGVDTITVPAGATTFQFPTPLAPGETYSVSISAQPLGFTSICAVSSGSGTVGTGNVGSVAISCHAAAAAVSLFAGTPFTPSRVTGTAVDSGGNIYEAANNEIRKITPAGVVTTLAGSGTVGSSNGIGTAASFNSLGQMAMDSAANLYVADASEIREITPAGVVTTVAGGLFPGLNGVAVDSAGNIYATDNNQIYEITSAGVTTTLAGSPTQGSADGTGASASFNYPSGVAADTAGNVYVADFDNNEIRKITPTGVVTTLAGSTTPGSADGTGASASFDGPSSVAVGASGNIYATDSHNNEIREITPAGVVTTLAGSTTTSGSADGIGTAASFNFPTGISADSAGNLYAADATGEIRKITPTAVVTTVAGTGTTYGDMNGVGSAARFKYPTGVAVDSAGNVYVADTYNNQIRKITPAGSVSTLAGSGTPGDIDGSGAAASFYYPRGIAVDANGNVYVTEFLLQPFGPAVANNIRKITPAGVVSIFAGGPGNPGDVDGTGTAAGFALPSAVAVDSAGNVYVADTGNCQIRKITPAGVVSTLAGSTAGHADGTGASASFNNPSGVAVDTSGNVYVADTSNNEIRKITPAGVVSTFAGSTTQGDADGTGASASFNGPSGVAVDSAGNVYVADSGNNEIRMITPDGVVRTLAGGSAPGNLNGIGAAASFQNPTGIAVDSAGNLYVADQANHVIRKITPQ